MASMEVRYGSSGGNQEEGVQIIGNQITHESLSKYG